MSSEYPRNPIAITEVGVTPEPSNEYQKLAAAVARAEAWLRQCSDWLLATDLDMQCPMETDPLDIADALSALKLPHAGDGITEQMVERGWSAFVMAMGDIEKDVLLDDMTPDEERAIVRAILVHALALSTPPAGVSDNG